MVQYIHTPWRDRAELLRVRQQFYPSPPAGARTITAEDEAEQQHAVSRVSMWMQRGGCPHLVESTALLVAAILSDLHDSRAGASSSSYAIRAAYSAAFSRFVTGLLDSQQDKQRKMSMYAVAKTIGLPATFVELRHQATHEQLPSLLKLRAAAKKALAWIWHYYWKNLPGDESSTTEDKADACRNLLIQYLRDEEQSTSKKSLRKRLRKWDQTLILQVLGEIGEASEDSKLLLRSLQLSRGILDGSFTTSPALRADGSQPRSAKDIEAIRAEVEKSRVELEDTPVGVRDKPLQPQSRTSLQTRGWSRYEGPWNAKPIGVI